jgi:Lysine methyltransferase
MRGRVLLTDRDAEVLEIAAYNILKNNVHRIAQTAQLEWDDDVTAAVILDDQFNLDPTRNRGFDIIVGSDCLYSGMDAVKQLFRLVSIMLTQDSGCAGARIESNINDGEIESSNDCRTSFDHCDHNAMDADDAPTAPTSINGGGWKFLDCDVKGSGNRRAAQSNHNSQAVFILGYERRLRGADIDMSAMFSVASDLGFEWCIAEDGVIDIFGNETSEQTLFWEQCVLLFTRRKVKSEVI